MRQVIITRGTTIKGKTENVTGKPIEVDDADYYTLKSQDQCVDYVPPVPVKEESKVEEKPAKKETEQKPKK